MTNHTPAMTAPGPAAAKATGYHHNILVGQVMRGPPAVGSALVGVSVRM